MGKIEQLRFAAHVHQKIRDYLSLQIRSCHQFSLQDQLVDGLRATRSSRDHTRILYAVRRTACYYSRSVAVRKKTTMAKPFCCLIASKSIRTDIGVLNAPHATNGSVHGTWLQEIGIHTIFTANTAKNFYAAVARKSRLANR